MSQGSSSKPIQKFFGSLTGADQLRMERNRLEAFLSAMPGEYCGFSQTDELIFSVNFPVLLGIEKLETIFDIQNALISADAASIENLFQNLKDNQTDFSVDVQTKNNKFLNLSGTYGQALDQTDHFNILWLKDITAEKTKTKQLLSGVSVRESEIKQLRTILDAIESPYWLRDSDAQIIWANKAYADMVRSNPQSVLRNQDEILIKSKDKNAIRSLKSLAEESLEAGTLSMMQGHVVTEGKRLFVEVLSIPILETQQTLNIMNDLSETEEKNTTYNRHLTANETLLEQLRTAVAIYNADEKLEFFNSAFSQLWDLDDPWLNTQPKLGDILEKLRETRRLPEQADFRNYKQGWLNMFTRLIDPYEDMMYLPDGSALRLLVMPHPVGGLMMTFEDVTSRLELESSYNTLIAVQKETLDNLAEGVAVFGSDGRLRLCNPSYTTLWQLNPEDLDGNPHITKLAERMTKLFDKEYKADQKEQLISHGIERKIQEGRVSISANMLIEYATVPLPDGGVLVSYFDVTDSVKVENALREKNAALETAEKLKTDFLANVSYQLRTPLNAIIGFAEILSNEYFGKMSSQQKEYSSGIQEAGDKLVSLIDDILDLSTIEAGYLELNYDEFDVHCMLNDLHNLTKEWGLKEKISVNMECSEDIGLLTADERRIKQILLNLVRNSINFTPEDGQITISAQEEDDYISFTVRDTGIGISENDLERIFEPFARAVHEHRADMSSQALSRGAGLGLSLVQNIVNLHDGSVTIESEEGKGTAVTFKIPQTNEGGLHDF